MMGQRKSDPQLFNYAVNLEKRVRAAHPLRRVKATIDFGFVREEVAHCYGRNGITEPLTPSECIWMRGADAALNPATPTIRFQWSLAHRGLRAFGFPGTERGLARMAIALFSRNFA
jgi:hypothetical protein